jgi:hypothetical protein
VFGPEVGTEANNGAIYDVLNANGSLNVRYKIISDSNVPEPSSLPLVGAGLGCIALVQLRKFLASRHPDRTAFGSAPKVVG